MLVYRSVFRLILFWEPTLATKPWITVGSFSVGGNSTVMHRLKDVGYVGREWFFCDCWRLKSFNKYWKKLLIFCKVCHRYGDILLVGCCGPFSLTWWIKSNCFRDATLTENLLPKTEFPWRFAHPTSVYYKLSLKNLRISLISRGLTETSKK